MGRLPTSEDFPKNVKLRIIPPPKGDRPTNVLLLLHGLGDKLESFARLGEQMSLPETVCISVQGAQNVLDFEGFHWGDDIIFSSSSGGLDPDAGFKQTTKILRELIEDALVKKCGYKPREIVLFGFGQGGMAALNLAVTIHDTELGGVISIGAPLPDEAPSFLVSKCKTPILVCAGSDQSSVTPETEEKLKRNFEFVEVKRYRKPGDSMPANRDEMMPIMQFFSRRLRSTKGVPKGSVEIS